MILDGLLGCLLMDYGLNAATVKDVRYHTVAWKSLLTIEILRDGAVVASINKGSGRFLEVRDGRLPITVGCYPNER